MYTYVGSDVHHDKHIEAFSQKISLKDHPLQEIIANIFSKGNTIFSKQKKKTQRLYFGSLLSLKDLLLV
jgi:hypothetical protein